MEKIVKLSFPCANSGKGCGGRYVEGNHRPQECEECRSKFEALTEPILFTDMRPHMQFQPVELTDLQRSQLDQAYRLLCSAGRDCTTIEGLEMMEELQNCLLELMDCQTTGALEGGAGQ